MTLLFLYLCLALVFTALCSILEATLLSCTPSYIESLDKKGYSPKTVTLVKNLKTNIDKSISSILTINTLASMMGAAGVGSQATLMFGEYWHSLLAFILTILVLYISEICPKTIGALYWKKFLIPAAYVIAFLIKLVYPFVWVASFLTNYIQKSKKKDTDSSEDEIMALVTLSEKAGTIEQKEGNLIENLFRLKGIKTEDIMTPRSVVFAFDSKITVEEAIENDNIYTYSRIPIFEESIDNIIGMVFSQVILEESVEDKDSALLKDIAVPVYKVKENLPVSTLIDLFIRKKSHLFVVIDDYEQTSGIVTLEDAIETLLGVEIVDESDEVTDMQEFAKSRNKKLQDELLLGLDKKEETSLI